MENFDHAAAVIPSARVDPSPGRRARQPRLIGELPCANCGHDFAVWSNARPTAYCSDGCAGQAETVRTERWLRARYPAGAPADVLDRVRSRRSFRWTSVGFVRQISDELRSRVHARDQGTCRLCGRQAFRVVRIEGSATTPENLWLLCAECDLARPPEERPDGGADPAEVAAAIDRRIAATEPERPCDQPGWDWRGYRRTYLRPISR